MNAPTAKEIHANLRSLGDPQIAEHSLRFFKTGKGEYGEGDRFLGIRVPEIRDVARQCRKVKLEVVRSLLGSPWHEARLLATVILVDQYHRGDDARKEAIYSLYCDNLRFINNWDIVDNSAPRLVGPHLETRDRAQLYSWAASSNLWERRIAIMATFHFIRQNDFTDALTLSERLLNDPEDLIHKAVGWMLREIGKKDRGVEEAFLVKHADRMPRTMLRYAIEKFPERERKAWLAKG